MKIKCDFCGAVIKKPAALLFGPPYLRTCDKDHLCHKCYRWILDQWEILIEQKNRKKKDRP